MATITLALIAACVAGFVFKTTRGLAIASMCALILVNPVAFVVLLVVALVGALLFIHFR